MVQPQGPDQPQQPYGQQPPQPYQQPYQQPPQYQPPGQPPPYPGQYPGAVQQPGKKVGPGGCLLSIGLFVLSIIAFVGLFVWAFSGIITTFRDAPAVPLGQTTEITLSETGTTYVWMGNLDSNTTLPVLAPDITITGPNGDLVPFSRASTSTSTSSGSNDFRLLGEFEARTTGSYTIESEDLGGRSGVDLYVTKFNTGSIVTKIGLAFAIGGLLFIVSIVLAIVWLVRRSKANKAYA